MTSQERESPVVTGLNRNTFEADFSLPPEPPQFVQAPDELYEQDTPCLNEPDHSDSAGGAWDQLAAQVDRDAEATLMPPEPEEAHWREFYGFDKPFVPVLPEPAPVPLELVALEDQPRPTALSEVSLRDVMTAELEPVRFAVNPWLPCRHVTLFGGHGGIGKSSLALAIGAHVAAGLPFAGHGSERLLVLFVSLEDEPSIVRLRLRRIIESYQLDPDEVLPRIRLLDGTHGFAALMSESDGHQAEPIFKPAFRELCEQVQGAGLIIIDNASDAYDANENSRRMVRTFMRSLALIARKHDAAVCLLAHIDKAAAKFGGQNNSYSGSTAWHNSARSRLALVEEEGRILLVHEKANLSTRTEPLPIMFADGIPMPESGAAGHGLVSEDFDRAEIVRALAAADDAGITVPASLTPGAHSAMAALETTAEFGQTFRGGTGRKRAARVILSLIREGRIVRESYRKPNRHLGERLVLAEKRAASPPIPPRALTQRI